MAELKYADVIVDVPIREITKSFQYIIPKRLSSQVEVGSIVLVPFGYAKRIGYVIGISGKPFVSKLSQIIDLLEETPLINKEMIKLCQWLGSYYIAPFGEALRLALPPGRTRRVNQMIALNGDISELLKEVPPQSVSEKKVLLKLSEMGGQILLKDVSKLLGRPAPNILAELEKDNLVKRKYSVTGPRVHPLSESWARLCLSPEEAKEIVTSLDRRAYKQQRILKILIEAPRISVHELLQATSASHSSLNSLVKKGWVEIFDAPMFREPDSTYLEENKLNILLTDEQVGALDKIKKSILREPQVFLLQGVTGSGKTEIYLQAIAYALKKGKTAIVLVPEIALTPQTVHRFKDRFGDWVAVFHSGLSLGERFDQWRKIKDGKCKVVVGTRSAVFTPVSNLGLIILDEEHDDSYKQNRVPRYHAREVAIKRAELNGASVILGSATPAIDTRTKADKGEYELICLTKRVQDRKLPQVSIVDMRKEKEAGIKGIFSSELKAELTHSFSRGEKTILFLNRRGFSSFILCRDCGFVVKCKKCAVSLTYHRGEKILKCHHCNYMLPAPSTCPQCQSARIGYFGVGTERVENELKRLYPEVPIVRMDADTTLRRGAHRKILVEFKKLESGVLLGTQMIAKGLDFPEITLVGIVNADTALNLPDFKAAERTFQLLMQVSGRAGRGPKPGKVIVQTYIPESYAIAALLAGDYDSFYNQEIEFRRQLNYPPFSRLINILISGKSEQKTAEAAVKVGKYMDEHTSAFVGILGPAPAPIPKLKGKHRWHVVLKTVETSRVQQFLSENFDRLTSQKAFQNVQVAIDVDPTSLL